MMQACQVQGHRGARGLFPENTVEGFRSAMTLGVRWFEIDVGVLRDGTVVVHHDVALNPDVASLDGRWPGGSLPLLKQLGWDELQDFSVGRLRPGSDYAAKWPDQVAVDGARVPRLSEVLALDAGVQWTIELKLMPDRPDWTVPAEEMVERVLREVDGAEAGARVVVQSFDWRAPRHVRRLRPEIRRGWLTRPETVADPVLWWGREGAPLPDAVAEEGGGMWTAAWETLTRDQVARSRALGVQVVPWTVNRVEEMRRLMEWGVDGLITDRPDLARRLTGPAQG